MKDYHFRQRHIGNNADNTGASIYAISGIIAQNLKYNIPAAVWRCSDITGKRISQSPDRTQTRNWI